MAELLPDDELRAIGERIAGATNDEKFTLIKVGEFKALLSHIEAERAAHKQEVERLNALRDAANATIAKLDKKGTEVIQQQQATIERLRAVTPGPSSR